MKKNAPLKLRNSLIAPFEVDLSLARGEVDSAELFDSVHEIYHKARSELKVVQTERKLRKKSRQSIPEPQLEPAEIIESPMPEMQRFNSSRVQAERSEKIAEMMTFCEGLEDYNVAMFYLEAQQWNVDQAISAYCDCTGSQDLRQITMYSITFVLPDKSRFSQEFEASASLWNMLTTVFEKLPEQREFQLKID